MGLGKYNATSAVHYFGTGPKAFISVYNTLARALELSLPLYILPYSRNNKTDF